MVKGRSQFIGAAGQFYLSYGLAVHEINASLTLGNAPSVDVLASSSDGLRSLSFQVKTSQNAYRPNRYGNEGYEWDVGSGVIGKHRESFWYAFINLRANQDSWNPEIFFVPSRWVAEFVKPDWRRYMYFLPASAKDITYERWDIVKGYLSGEEGALAWATHYPEEKLVKWGATC